MVSFYLNRNQIGRGLVEEGNIGENPNDQVTLQSTINLKKGDQVWLEITISSGAAYLHDESSNHYTHYTGFMLEEEIVSTLWDFEFLFYKSSVVYIPNKTISMMFSRF